jgi:YcaO-like protein with predicted kinase domain
MMTRAEQRRSSADYLNSLSRDDLFNRFEVTRVADLTGYDIIGVPVYSCSRPCGKSISVSGGKGWTRAMVRAGAIAEAAEFHTFENPSGDFTVEPFGKDPGFPTCKGSKWTPETPVAVEMVDHFATGQTVRFPSELIWMTKRADLPKHFMRSSNGQAVASTFYDAFLTGLYEVVERDQVTLRRVAWKKVGVPPPRVALPDIVSASTARLSLSLYLFDCSLDLHFPTFWAILAGEDGTFAGYGCNIRSSTAAERAILEAIQSRAVWLSGARDDILRRDFQNNRDRTLTQVRSELDPLPISPFPPDQMPELSVEDELMVVLHKLAAYRNNIYYKHIDLGYFHAVKTVVLGLECPQFISEETWRPIRFTTLAQAYIDSCHNQGKGNCGVARQLKEMSFET